MFVFISLSLKLVGLDKHIDIQIDIIILHEVKVFLLFTKINVFILFYFVWQITKSER